jgi:hypothetical protein
MAIGLAILFFILTLVFSTYFAQGWFSWHDYNKTNSSVTKAHFSQVMTWMALAFAILSLIMAGFFAFSRGGGDGGANINKSGTPRQNIHIGGN